LKADLLLVVGVGRVGRKSTVASMNMQIKDALIEAGEQGLTEMDIFKQFKIGRPEMNRKVRLFLKVADPDSRVWVSFKDGVYRVEALGANPPEEWGGYLPSDVEQL
jgi:ligand-binding sensor domain-containing protein